MKEQLITFNTAKLTKKKGFNIVQRKVYFNGELSNLTLDDIVNNKLVKNIKYAPTQSLLQKWLRKKYLYNVYPVQDDLNNWMYKIIGINQEMISIESEACYKSYEEALEEGLIEALKLIK